MIGIPGRNQTIDHLSVVSGVSEGKKERRKKKPTLCGTINTENVPSMAHDPNIGLLRSYPLVVPLFTLE